VTHRIFLNANALRAQGVVPTLPELDALAPHNPIYIQAPTNRVPNFAVLNSAALQAAGITADIRVSPHSQVELDGAGRPTGLLHGALQPIYNADPLYQLVERAAPVPTYENVRDGIAILAKHFAAHGSTTLLGGASGPTRKNCARTPNCSTKAACRSGFSTPSKSTAANRSRKSNVI